MDLEQKAIERIKTASVLSLHHYGQPLVCTYSGGKDSDVMLHLFEASGIPFEVHNSHVTVDAPPTVHHIRDTFKRLEEKGIKTTIDYHVRPDGTRTTMWNLIIKNLMPPTRIVRFCCAEMKETGCKNRMIATGVRWDESKNRKNTREAYENIANKRENKIVVSDEKMLLSDQDSDVRKLFEQCELKAKTVVNPIIDWKDKDIWEYINSEKIQTNELYQCGYSRVGCIGCPMAGYKGRMKQFSDFPKYKQAYIRTFQRVVDIRGQKGMENKCKSGEEMFHRWMEDPGIYGQMNIFDFIEE